MTWRRLLCGVRTRGRHHLLLHVGDDGHLCLFCTSCDYETRGWWVNPAAIRRSACVPLSLQPPDADARMPSTPQTWSAR